MTTIAVLRLRSRQRLMKLWGWLAYDGRPRRVSPLLRTVLWRWRVCDAERQRLKLRVRELEARLRDRGDD